MICMSSLSFNATHAQTPEVKITLWVKIHRIKMIDIIERASQAEHVDWHYYLTINNEGLLYYEDSAYSKCGIDKIVDDVYSFEIAGRYVRVYIDLFDDDLYSRPDLADISSRTGAGIDNHEDFTRGTRFSALYDVKNDKLLDADIHTLESGYYVTSGEYDGSTDVDENDAELWFSIWDDYDAPKAEAGPEKECRTDERVTFDGSGSAASNGSSIVKYEWDFEGDGEYDADGVLQSHVYDTKGKYTVSLRVTDSLGEVDVDTCTVYVGDMTPITSFIFSPSEPSIEDTIQFNDTSRDTDGQVKFWLWDFGDGQTSIERNPTHNYTDKGTYWVSLTAEDDVGNVNTSRTPITVVNLPPVAEFDFSPKDPNEGADVYFMSESRDPEGRALQWEWAFGDGQTSAEQNPVHGYLEASPYTVSLTVRDDEGGSDSMSRIVNVVQGHDLTLVVRDLLGLAVANAGIEIYSDGIRVAADSTDGKGMLELSGVPEGLYEVRVKSLGITTSLSCPLTGSLTKKIPVFLSVYTVGMSVGVMGAISVVGIYALRRRRLS